MKEVITAIRNGDRKSVEDALSQDPTLAHDRDENGVSLICLAIYHGQNEIANLLAENRDDLDIFEATVIDNAERVQQLAVANPELVNAYSPDGFHPLGYACFFGRLKTFDVLISAGADLEAPVKNAMGVRPLHSAVAHSDRDAALVLARRLLELGASTNVVQHGGFTPLHEAALRGHVDLVQLLLDHGADPKAHDDSGKTPLELARDKGHTEVAELMESAI